VARPKVHHEDMTSVTVRIPTRFATAIEELAAERGVPKSELYREAVRAFLFPEARPAGGQARARRVDRTPKRTRGVTLVQL